MYLLFDAILGVSAHLLCVMAGPRQVVTILALYLLHLVSDRYQNWHCNTAPGESDLAIAGQYWRHLPTERQLRFFPKKVARFVSMYLLWKNSRQNGPKVTKYCAKVTLICVRCGSWWQGAVGICGGQCGYCGGPPQINQHMGSTDCL